MAKRRETPGAVLLAHGAGSDRDHHTLLALEHALAPRAVSRFNFPYRAAGKRFPDKAPVLVAAIRQAATELAADSGCAPSALVLGGRSLGGRMCSMAVAEGLPAAGLVLISYPLHPPGKPDRLRVEHFEAIAVPTLFISGTKDAFGSPGELTSATTAIPAPVTHVWLDGGNHSLDRRDPAIVEAVLGWLATLSG